jgi:pSer/pThr/pTyr-binding forkhead associated (FHA) protein
MRVGRSSKSHQKAILPESRNAYIESQVVSRNHAVFSLGKSDDDNAVYLTDTGSMHGTKVNNIKLDPNQPHRLCSNDKLSFGGEVQRGMGKPSLPLTSCYPWSDRE